MVGSLQTINREKRETMESHMQGWLLTQKYEGKDCCQ